MNSPFAELPRPARAVELPGGGVVHVRSVTVGEMRRADAEADRCPEGPEREVRRVETIVAFAVTHPDGRPAFDLPADDKGALASAVAELESHLTPEQLNAVFEAAVPSKESAKKA